MEELRADIKELKADVKELVKLGAVHNVLLETHEGRSLELKSRQDLIQARLLPLEKQSVVVTVVFSALGTLMLVVLGKIVLTLLHLS